MKLYRLPFHRHPMLLSLASNSLAYRLIQVRKHKLVIVHSKVICFEVPRGLWKNRSTHIAVWPELRCLRLLTESADGQRQIWLVDMKVKL